MERIVPNTFLEIWDNLEKRFSSQIPGEFEMRSRTSYRIFVVPNFQEDWRRDLEILENFGHEIF